MLMTSVFRMPWSPEFVPVEVLLFGGCMLVMIVLIHGAGLDRMVTHYDRWADRLRSRARHHHFATVVFASTILFMLGLHITETCIWGGVLYKVRLITSLRDSIYFSANTYTTIGYGKMILPDNWRELSPIMAISGLFTFAWTTGEMFGVVGKQRELVKDLRKHRARKPGFSRFEHQRQRKMSPASSRSGDSD